MSNSQCYQLGRALHYLTDMTQPMHTTSFSGLTVPTQLHPVWEMYVVPLVKGLTPVAFGDRFQANMPCASTSNCTSDEVFEMTAWRTTDNWANGIMKILTAGDACTYTIFAASYNTTGSCFRAYGPSDNLAKQILADAVPSVTAYLYSLRNNIARVKKTVSCGSNVYGLANAPADANGVVSAIVKLENGTWQPVANTLPALDFVVGGANCLVWSMDKDRKVSGPTGGKTVLSLANSLAIGANGDVWMIDSDFVPAKLNPSDMQFHEPQGIGRTGISKIAVSPAGVVYGIVTASNLIHRLATNQWQNTSATALDIS